MGFCRAGCKIGPGRSPSPVKQSEIIRHFASVREATELPIVIYNIPSRTMSSITAEAVLDLIGSIPDVIAYKDSSGDMSQFQHVLRLTRDLPNFSVLQGSHSLSISSILIGAHGLVPSSSCHEPRRVGSPAMKVHWRALIVSSAKKRGLAATTKRRSKWLTPCTPFLFHSLLKRPQR